MYLNQASSDTYWDTAENILREVVIDLDVRSKKLWTLDQIDKSELKKVYKIDELFLLTDNLNIFGIVFIQNRDPIFWPEVSQGDSIFLHKLAVRPQYRNQDLGFKILTYVVALAKRKKIKWLRLDCDVRPELKTYYENFGFTFVDEIRIEEFRVARYQLLVEDF
ncbi:MAG: N-acetyltransferase [Gammaproteobacteria bacterium]|nr:MAG: N-acetyltransferase [Gammaproteobacteria bacterium]